jgi:hypothetical protein
LVKGEREQIKVKKNYRNMSKVVESIDCLEALSYDRGEDTITAENREKPVRGGERWTRHPE